MTGPADRNAWTIRRPSTGDAQTSTAVPAVTSVTRASRRQRRSVGRPSTPVADVERLVGGGSIAGSLPYAIPAQTSTLTCVQVTATNDDSASSRRAHGTHDFSDTSTRHSSLVSKLKQKNPAMVHVIWPHRSNR